MKTSLAFISYHSQLPDWKTRREQLQMKDTSANSKVVIPPAPLSNERKAGDYLYQGATLVAALLLVLSAVI